ANLYHKRIRSVDESYCEFCPGTLETDDHIFVNCPRAQDSWARLGITVDPRGHTMPWLLGCALPLPDQIRTDIAILILWHIWKARNAKIFEQLVLTPQEVIRRAARDVEVWSCRYRKLRPHILAWRDFLFTRC
ncbi:hypothetical protein SETIT_9G522400v2, partial [Setaria italica]